MFITEIGYYWEQRLMLIIPVFVPHEGCPHDCCFCDQKKISGQKSIPTDNEIRKNIDSYLNIVSNYDVVQIAFFGGSFTAIPKETQKKYLDIASAYIRAGYVDSIRVSTRPDYIDDETLNILKSYNVRTIELGAQSMDDNVLKASRRGHNSLATVNASELIKRYGFELGLQTMTGLPGSTYESDIKTADEIIRLCPDIVRIYPTVVIYGTFLHYLYENKKYIPPSLEETIALCAELMLKYKSNHIEVIRMGLQSSDGISLDGDIAAGPYHPAFGQLVRSKIAYENLTKIGDVQNNTFTAYVPERELSDYIGQKKSNIKALKEEFGYKDVFIKPIK